MSRDYQFEAVVIGEGIVGLAVAQALALRGRGVLVVERHAFPVQETSSRNSGVIHSGIYYPTDSLKARFCVSGRELLYEFAARRGVPHRRCGKLDLDGITRFGPNVEWVHSPDYRVDPRHAGEFYESCGRARLGSEQR